MTLHDKIIILDETKGKSAKGKTMKWISEKFDIPYYTNSKELLKELQ